MKKLIMVGLILPLFFLPQQSHAFIGAWIAKKQYERVPPETKERWQKSYKQHFGDKNATKKKGK